MTYHDGFPETIDRATINQVLTFLGLNDKRVTEVDIGMYTVTITYWRPEYTEGRVEVEISD